MTARARAGGRRQALRFSGRLLMALALAGAVALLGVALEHSSLSQRLAPHSYDSLKSHLVFRHGLPYVEDVVTVDGRQRVTVRPVPLKKGAHPQVGARVRAGTAAPPDLSSWHRVMIDLALVAAIASAAAGLDRLGRRVWRGRRLAPLRKS